MRIASGGSLPALTSGSSEGGSDAWAHRQATNARQAIAMGVESDCLEMLRARRVLPGRVFQRGGIVARAIA